MTLYFNLESLVLPDSQVHPFYTPSSRPIFGDVRRCSTMFGEVRRGSAMLSDVIRCYPMFSDVRRCSTMFNDVRRCSTMFGDVRRCSAILSDVQRYYPMFSDIIRASIHDRDTSPRPDLVLRPDTDSHPISPSPPAPPGLSTGLDRSCRRPRHPIRDSTSPNRSADDANFRLPADIVRTTDF